MQPYSKLSIIICVVTCTSESELFILTQTSVFYLDLVDGDHLPTLIVVLVTGLALVVLIVGVIYLYRRRTVGSRGSYEGARYSRTNSSLTEQTEKNILVSDMELNEQAE